MLPEGEEKREDPKCFCGYGEFKTNDIEKPEPNMIPGSQYELQGRKGSVKMQMMT